MQPHNQNLNSNSLPHAKDPQLQCQAILTQPQPSLSKAHQHFQKKKPSTPPQQQQQQQTNKPKRKAKTSQHLEVNPRAPSARR